MTAYGRGSTEAEVKITVSAEKNCHGKGKIEIS